jgi:hypothetical protein
MPRHVEISYGYTLRFRGRLRGDAIDELQVLPLTASDDDEARVRCGAILAGYRFRLEELELRRDRDRLYVPLYAPRTAWEALE